MNQRSPATPYMSAKFADTNVVLYLLDDGSKADRGEAMVNCRRKTRLSWEETGAFLSGIQSLCPVEVLNVQTHKVGRALAETYRLPVHDAMIVAAALIAGCSTLWSEDMHDGLLVENRLRIINPFV